MQNRLDIEGCIDFVVKRLTAAEGDPGIQLVGGHPIGDRRKQVQCWRLRTEIVVGRMVNVDRSCGDGIEDLEGADERIGRMHRHIKRAVRDRSDRSCQSVCALPPSRLQLDGPAGDHLEFFDASRKRRRRWAPYRRNSGRAQEHLAASCCHRSLTLR
jgi:hypothetical protein